MKAKERGTFVPLFIAEKIKQILVLSYLASISLFSTTSSWNIA